MLITFKILVCVHVVPNYTAEYNFVNNRQI